MGRDKALLPLPSESSGSNATFLSAAIHSFNQVADLVIVVVGKNETTLAPIIYGQGAFLVRNPRPEDGQFSSLQIGLQEVLNRGRDSAMITLVDRPPAAITTLQMLKDSFADATSRGKWAVVPQKAGKHGHPIVIGREMIEAFLKAPITTNAREIEHKHESHIEYIEVDDPRVVTNINTPEDYVQLSSTELNQ